MLQTQDLGKKGYIQFKSDTNKKIIEVANELGKVSQVVSIPLVQTLTPRKSDNESKNTYSGNFGLDQFPMHTDLAHWHIPFRYLLLRCVMPADNVATKIVDSKIVLEGERKSDISRAHFKPRRLLGHKSNLLKLYQNGVFRWDSLFIVPGNKLGEILKQKVEAKLQSLKPNELTFDNPGDCLLIDNWRILHGRSRVPETALHRKIERVYLSEIRL